MRSKIKKIYNHKPNFLTQSKKEFVDKKKVLMPSTNIKYFYFNSLTAGATQRFFLKPRES